MPAVVYSDTYTLTGPSGSATVELTVTEDAPGYTGEYLWNYHVTNDSFDSGDGQGVRLFSVALDPNLIANVGNSLGWSSGYGLSSAGVGGGDDSVFWHAGSEWDPEIGQPGDFWFTTEALGFGESRLIASDVEYAATSESTAIGPGSGAAVYHNTFDWNGVATVLATVIADAPGHAGEYLWNYHVTNTSSEPGIGTFAVPAEDASMVSNLGNSLGWTGSIGTFLSNSDLVSWQTGGSTLGIGDSTNFWFTTEPVGVGLSNGVASNLGLTSLSGGILAIPLAAAPVPQQTAPFIVTTTEDTLPNNLLTLREAMQKVNDGFTIRGQVVTEIRFAEGITGQTITLNEQLPEIKKEMFINGDTRNITVARDPMKGNFGLFQAGDSEIVQLPSVKIRNLTLKGGGGTGGNVQVNQGGAIWSYAKLELTGCTIRDNEARLQGGGVYAGGGTLTITNCNIFNNWGGSGGGVFIGEYVTAANITGGSIHDNNAWFGGGIYIRGESEVPIELLGVQISQNTATNNGGGIAVVDNQDNLGSPELTIGGGTVIMNNSATGANSEGGGIYFGAGTLALSQVPITGNWAARGGGLYLVNGTSASGYVGYVAGNSLDDILWGA